MLNLLPARTGASARRLAGDLATTLFLLGTLTATASAGSSVIVLSDNFPADQREAIERVLAQVLARQQPGDRLVVLSARGGTRIASVEIPPQPAYQQDRHRVPLLRPAFADIRTALDAAVAAGPPQDGGAPGQINLPGLIEPLRYHVRGGEHLRVMVVGTQQHDDRTRAPAFSMAGAVPEGNHVGQSLEASPFGLAGREGSLPVHLDWCSTERAWVNEDHRNGVQAFYAGYLAHLGGRLMTMTQDLAMCASRFVTAATDQAPAVPTTRPNAPPVMRQVQAVLTVPAASLQADQAALLARMALPAPQAATLTAQITAGKVRLIEVDAYDTDDEDGDVAGIRTSSGVTIRIPLRKVPTRVIIPVEDQSLTVVALVDGAGGGVTLGIRLPSASGRGQEIHTQRMAVGQTIRIPVRVH